MASDSHIMTLSFEYIPDETYKFVSEDLVRRNSLALCIKKVQKKTKHDFTSRKVFFSLSHLYIDYSYL